MSHSYIYPIQNSGTSLGLSWQRNRFLLNYLYICDAAPVTGKMEINGTTTITIIYKMRRLGLRRYWKEEIANMTIGPIVEMSKKHNNSLLRLGLQPEKGGGVWGSRPTPPLGDIDPLFFSLYCHLSLMILTFSLGFRDGVEIVFWNFLRKVRSTVKT